MSGTGRCTPAERDFLHALARAAVAAAARGEEPPDPAALARARGLAPGPHLLEPRGAFVTLRGPGGALRGCIGSIAAPGPLLETVARSAREAAVHDPRFAPVGPGELDGLQLEISVLTPLREVSDPAEIEPGRHGVLLERGGHAAVFLPQVATEQGWDRTMLLDQLAVKAGLPPGSWREGARLQVFAAEVF